MEANQESMAGKKARNHPKWSSKTHRFTNPSRTSTTPPGNFYLAKTDMSPNHSYPYSYPISSSSSLSRLDIQYSINRFEQPPLLPLPIASLSSSSSSSSSEFNNKLDTKQAPKLSSTCKAKKYPDSKPGHGYRAKRWAPDPKSEKAKDEKEMKFCESLIYAMSPSPSSLPMPKFAILKPKLTS